LFLCGLALAWLTLWGERRDSRLGQFGVGSLLFLAVYIAMYCGVVRWVWTTESERAGSDPQDYVALGAIAAVCLVVGLVGIPFLVRMTEALLWGAVWLLNHPWVRSRRRARLRAKENHARMTTKE
jgi:uncharacterized membrane protein YidH (DUF202 family)